MSSFTHISPSCPSSPPGTIFISCTIAPIMTPHMLTIIMAPTTTKILLNKELLPMDMPFFIRHSTCFNSAPSTLFNISKEPTTFTMSFLTPPGVGYVISKEILFALLYNSAAFFALHLFNKLLLFSLWRIRKNAGKESKNVRKCEMKLAELYTRCKRILSKDQHY